MLKHKITFYIIITFILMVFSIIGCSGGSGDSDVPNAPGISENADSSGKGSISTLPSHYDFGNVTFGNAPTPLKIKITNTGSEDLNIYDISMSENDNFGLVLDSGPNSCSTDYPMIAAGDTCTLEVAFQPSELGVFEATLAISSDDPSLPISNVEVKGLYEPESELNVRINQIESNAACPEAEVTAYISVTDQGGYPVKGLLAGNFSIFENTTQLSSLTDLSFASQVNTSLSVALAMDYSGSITDNQEYVDDMQDALADFIGKLGINDEAEIIKFDTEIEIVRSFTSDKASLIESIYTQWDRGRQTNLYDAVLQAVVDTAGRSKVRRAVIIITDGENKSEMTNSSLDDVIRYANEVGVPIFSIGLGKSNDPILKEMADATGGQFYGATTSDNLGNTYQQLVDILFDNQYILTYVSSLGVGESAGLRIEANSMTITGEDTKEIRPCAQP